MKKELITQIDINAPASAVWKIMTDLEKFEKWNPFVRKASGKVAVGEVLEVHIGPSGSETRLFTPKVLVADKEREFRWIGTFKIPGLFYGEHYYKIEKINAKKIRFIHGEIFSGLMIRFMQKALDTDTLRGFIEMNKALKKAAEKKK